MTSNQARMVFPPQLEERYEILRELGQGAYGLVCAARNKLTGQEVAVKKVTKIFDKDILAKRALREVKLLKHFNGHENITALFDVDLQDPNDYNEIFLVQELMEADLHQIIRSQQSLTDAHYQYFIYQICRGLKYIHSAQVLHRDLKPGNLLVNADCELKICDFGLARGFSDAPENSAGFMTEYVATRWYRAPEIMLSFKSYTKAIDMWSVGCIMAELLGSKPLFKGRDYVDQLNQILAVCGTPDDETLARIGSDRAQMYIKSLPFMPKVPFNQVYPNASPEAIDLIDKLLQFDPAKRITVEEALEHPYLDSYHDKDDEPNHTEAFDFSFEATESIDQMKVMIAHEISQYKATQGTSGRNAPLKLDAAAAGALPTGDVAMNVSPDTAMDVDEELRKRDQH
ncbi:kinase-like domain-containing protein, partial [Globomyces pollinis-pini]